MTRVTGRMSQVRLELDVAKYEGADVDELLREMDEVQNRMCRIAFLAGAITVNMKKQLALRRLGGDVSE
jgi:hypothetical protein